MSNLEKIAGFESPCSEEKEDLDVKPRSPTKTKQTRTWANRASTCPSSSPSSETTDLRGRISSQEMAVKCLQALIENMPRKHKDILDQLKKLIDRTYILVLTLLYLFNLILTSSSQLLSYF